MRASEDEMAGWHQWCNGHELGQTPGDGEGQGGLACWSPWGCKQSDTTEQLNNKNQWNSPESRQEQRAEEGLHTAPPKCKNNPYCYSSWETPTALSGGPEVGDGVLTPKRKGSLSSKAEALPGVHSTPSTQLCEEPCRLSIPFHPHNHEVATVTISMLWVKKTKPKKLRVTEVK